MSMDIPGLVLMLVSCGLAFYCGCSLATKRWLIAMVAFVVMLIVLYVAVTRILPQSTPLGATIHRESDIADFTDFELNRWPAVWVRKTGAEGGVRSG